MIVWKSIKGHPGYEVSNKGEVKSPTRILKPIYDGGGYPMVQLKRKNTKIHRLVAMAFLRNPHDKCCVNHINGNKKDNRVDNLEWVTYSENAKHAFRTGLHVHYQTGKSGKLHRASKPLVSINQTAIVEHESRSLCAKYFGVDVRAVNNALSKGYHCKGSLLYDLAL